MKIVSLKDSNGAEIHRAFQGGERFMYDLCIVYENGRVTGCDEKIGHLGDP